MNIFRFFLIVNFRFALERFANPGKTFLIDEEQNTGQRSTKIEGTFAFTDRNFRPIILLSQFKQ